jgi:uncharacterized membrane protein YphA (DoxX/SURF4 family)
MLRNLTKDRLWDYLILVSRVLLAWTFLRYGFSKLTGGQFGVTEAEMTTPLKDLSLFKVSWFLFDQEPFKSFIGVSQLICGTLLLVNRTALVGAFMFLPIVTAILVIDLSFMPEGLAFSFAWRLSFYILLDLLIIWHYREQVRSIWEFALKKVTTKFKYPWWAYFILPIAAIGLEIVGALPKILVYLITDPAETLESLTRIPELIEQLIDKTVAN